MVRQPGLGAGPDYLKVPMTLGEEMNYEEFSDREVSPAPRGSRNQVSSLEHDHTPLLPAVFVPEDLLDLFFESRKVVCRIVPQDRFFDPEVTMGKNITEAGNFFPVCRRILLPEFIGKFLYCLTDDLKVPNHGIPAAAIR